MFMRIVLLSWATALVLAAPPVDVVPLEKQQPTVIPILSQSDELEANGTYKFSYETGNGIKREETAYEKVVPRLEGRSASSNEGGESDESDEIHVQRGSYSYTAPDGTVITVSYIADENGFQPIGDHIPRVPGISSTSSHSAEKTGRALKHPDSVESASVVKESKAELKSAPPSTPQEESKSAETVLTSSLQAEPAPAEISTEQKASPSTTSESTSVDDASVAPKEEESSSPVTESEQTEATTSVASEESKSTVNLESSSEPASTTEAVTQGNDGSTTAAVASETQSAVSTSVPEEASTTISSGSSDTETPSSTVLSSNEETVSTEANQPSTTESVQLSTENENQSTTSEALATEEASSTTVSAS